MSILDNSTLEGVLFTFSRHCHSGIVYVLGPAAKCGCWRCRVERGEPWDAATEEAAAVASAHAQRLFRDSVLGRGPSDPD